MNEPPRVTPEEIYPQVQSGETLLVCGYDDDAKFRRMRLQGAISFAELKSRLPGLPRDQEIVFYCAWTSEATAAGRAVGLIKQGYTNAKALKGGVEGWTQAGYSLVEGE